MLVMSEWGADKLLSSKFTLGAEGSVAAGSVAAGSVAAGSVGHRALAPADPRMRVDILRWMRSHGCLKALLYKPQLCGRLRTIMPPSTNRQLLATPA
jgi:lipid-binding SYLF domain-containing protein